MRLIQLFILFIGFSFVLGCVNQNPPVSESIIGCWKSTLNTHPYTIDVIYRFEAGGRGIFYDVSVGLLQPDYGSGSFTWSKVPGTNTIRTFVTQELPSKGNTTELLFQYDEQAHNLTLEGRSFKRINC
jgi:hypothetical protein